MGAVLAAGCLALAAEGPMDTAAIGHTDILKWKDGKQAVFLLQFDDSCASHVDYVIPELHRQGLVGTFYINPGNGPFKSRQAAWEKQIPAMGMEYGNHTFTHAGATNAAQLDVELARCSEAIARCFPDRPRERLVAFGRPGGVPWTVSEAEQTKAFETYHLVQRPPFWGPPIHMKTVDDVLRVIDKALAEGEMGHLDFHGVGGDWLVTPKAMFAAILEKLAANRDRLWVTDMVSWHAYQAERKAASVKVLGADASAIRLDLAMALDPALYDRPLTLVTTVPAAWRACVVTQGKAVQRVVPRDGRVQYEARPAAGEIRLAGAEPGA